MGDVERWWWWSRWYGFYQFWTSTNTATHAASCHPLGTAQPLGIQLGYGHPPRPRISTAKVALSSRQNSSSTCGRSSKLLKWIICTCCGAPPSDRAPIKRLAIGLIIFGSLENTLSIFAACYCLLQVPTHMDYNTRSPRIGYCARNVHPRSHLPASPPLVGAGIARDASELGWTQFRAARSGPGRRRTWALSTSRHEGHQRAECA